MDNSSYGVDRSDSEEERTPDAADWLQMGETLGLCNEDELRFTRGDDGGLVDEHVVSDSLRGVTPGSGNANDFNCGVRDNIVGAQKEDYCDVYDQVTFQKDDANDGQYLMTQVIPAHSRDMCNFFLENAVQDTIDNTGTPNNALAAIRHDVNDAIDYHGGSSSRSKNSSSIHDNFVDTHQNDALGAYESSQNDDPPQDYAAFANDFCMQCTQGPAVNHPYGSEAAYLQAGNSEALLTQRGCVNMNRGQPMPCEHPQAGRPGEPPQAIKSDASFSLRQWINYEKTRSNEQDGLSIHYKASILRKLTVAYGIGKLIESCNDPIDSIMSEDNFVVRETSYLPGTRPHRVSDVEVVGVDLISQQVSVNISFEFIQRLEVESSIEDMPGRFISATVSTSLQQKVRNETQDQARVCFAFGQLLRILFSGDEYGHSELNGEDKIISRQPAKRQTRDVRVSFSQASISESNSVWMARSGTANRHVCQSLIEFGCPSPIEQLVTDLLSCGDSLFCPDSSFQSLKEATDEIHLLLEEPTRFLFQSAYQLSWSDRVFGRSEEISIIVDAYQRVALTGKGEAVVIGGCSGSGKSRLVQKVIDSVNFAGDTLAVTQKFNSESGSFAVVLKVFDEMCIQIARNTTTEQKQSICANLNREFGRNAVRFLACVVPNVLLFLSPDSTLPFTHETDNGNDNAAEGNFISMCFTLQRFMIVISKSIRSCIIIFLDDLQWADPMSLGLIHSLLSSNVEGDMSWLLFVGTYRTEHAQLLSDFVALVSRLNFPLTKITLDDLPPNEVTQMISYALSIVPRLCSTLSNIVHKKTKGNPFFVKEFMRSLVDNGLIVRSLREQRWVWDVDEIGAQPVTENVLELITSKMRSAAEDTQTALKVIACFGIKLASSVVNALSSTDAFPKLLPAMKEAVQDGFVDFDGVYYRFVHDSVRQSAYALIDKLNVKSYHYEIGIALLPSCMNPANGENNELLFTTLGQINHGAENMFTSPSQMADVAQLNLQAGVASMKGWNFPSALAYLKAAHMLLPTDSWDRQDYYSLNLNIHYSKAKAAYACGEIETAKASLHEIDLRARCLEDKLDANHLLVDILHHRQEDSSQALDVCCKMLNLLGQPVPYPHQLPVATQLLQLARTRLNSAFTSDEDFCNMQFKEDKHINDTMRFYAQLTVVSYTKGGKNGEARGFLCGYYMSRWVTYFLQTRVVCSYTAFAMGFYSAALCYGFDERTCREGLRLGNFGLMYLDQNKESVNRYLPGVYLSYYGFAAVLKEPIQYCIMQHRRAYDIGMKTGNTSDAFFNLAFMIPRMIDVGENLLTVKKEILFYQQLAEKHNHPVLLKHMEWYHDTISQLLDKRQMDIPLPESSEKTGITDATAIHIVQLLIPACYLGHMERVHFLCKKWESLDLDQTSRVVMRTILVAFYQGLACASSYLKKKSKALLSKLIESIKVLKKASGFCEWNFANKKALLQAEMFSIECKDESAEEMYDCAIKRAQASKFINEEGLTCELAAKHYLRTNDHEMAKSLFGQAEKCYRKWGSEKKAQLMIKAIEQIA